ncbi:mitochondrial dehydrogenase/reductase SDR family member 12 [Andalucia godoyi]|uniref:Mitochondrial dehydrogenase/reductase SDR family member 12 n=1 Tax=Andalucia godoyi TaxID=505711 RepID=A0A8K0AH83_ANDGO|nr:mitochondrial dehydrogenase/reductase SDR family member 12 [Andalucia godoyi]|eukprot:ANDGO_07878.mRNA.1 mitochondrial dehydrogenase/reductase SDR family member 12
MVFQFYKTLVFGVRGYRNFTKQGFLRNAAKFDAADLHVDLSNRHFIVSGSNSGIGFETARGLASLGAVVHMLCRNRERAEAARLKIIEDVPNADVRVHLADMSCIKSVLSFAEQFRSEKWPLHGLVLNAANHYAKRTATDEGFDASYATNVLSVFVLARELQEAVSASSGRIIMVSSGGMLTEVLDANDLECKNFEPWDGLKVYAKNKRAVVALAEVLAAENAHVYSCHPGWVDTPLVQEHLPNFRKKLEGKLREPPQGADTLVWLCAAPDAALARNGVKPGDFVFDRMPASKSIALCGVPSASDKEKMMLKLDADFALSKL